MATARTLLSNFNNVKTLPHVEIRLSKLISDEHSTMKEFEEVIRLDPTLVLRLLRLVNSSYYGLRQKPDAHNQWRQLRRLPYDRCMAPRELRSRQYHRQLHRLPQRRGRDRQAPDTYSDYKPVRRLPQQRSVGTR